jgi:hypothetical protein
MGAKTICGIPTEKVNVKAYNSYNNKKEVKEQAITLIHIYKFFKSFLLKLNPM